MAAKIDEIDSRIAGLRRMREELARVVGCACDSLDHCTCGAAYLARRGKESGARPPVLHVTNGESAGNTLRQTSIGGAVLPWQDVLHEGPVQAVSRQELLRTRAGFLSDCGWGSRRAVLSSLERRDRQLAEALRDGLQVVLWFEHDLYDQLQLLDALALAPRSAFVAAQRLEDAPFLGDAWFYRALAALGRGSVRLVETQEGEPLPAPPPLGDGHCFARLSLRLTAEGEQVLRGESDRVDLLGVDRWIGGTHVTPQNAWRWDPAARRLLAPATGDSRR